MEKAIVNQSVSTQYDHTSSEDVFPGLQSFQDTDGKHAEQKCPAHHVDVFDEYQGLQVDDSMFQANFLESEVPPAMLLESLRSNIAE